MTRLAELLPPPAEWARRTDPERPVAAALGDPVWRIANLYTIYDKKSQAFVPFRPKPEQQIIIWDLFVRGIKNLIIPKARQIGFSTLLALIALDMVLWQSGAKAALVDKTKDDGMKKMQDIVRVAWDRLPEPVRALFGEPVLNHTEFGVHLDYVDTDGWSRFRVEKSGRGDALVFLWVSEWGTIQFEEPKRSLEIRTGGMAAAEGGIRVIETTWKGGEGGDVWPYVEMALSKPDPEKDPATDWYIRFFPWWVEPTYSLTATGTVRPHIAAYLDAKAGEITAALGRPFVFTDGQRAWYDRREAEFGLFVKREYPTTLEECWEAPVEGAVYADLYAQALAEGRVFAHAYVPGVPVFTLWDLGSPENTVVWYCQHVGGQVRFVDCDTKLWMTTAQRVEHMRGKGYAFSKHYLPHDATSMKTSVLTFRGELVAAGLEGTVVVPRTKDIELGINRTRILFPAFVFDPVKCAEGVKAVKAYHRHPERHDVVHDWASHAADALKVLAEAESGGILALNLDTAMPHEHLRFFDPDGLDVLRQQTLAAAGDVTHGTLDSETFRRCPEDEAWLRLWAPPAVGWRYLITLVRRRHEREGDALVVWTVDDAKLRLAACLEPGMALDVPVLARWTAALSRHYGGALVAPVVDEASGLLEALVAEGCGALYAREQPREARRIGQGKRLRKRGYELTEQAREQALMLLQDAVREETLHIAGCAELLDQLENTIQPTPDEAPRPAPGHGEAWVLAAGIAQHVRRAATVMAAPPPPPAWTDSGRRYVETAGAAVGAFSGDAES